jgi:two-component system phosphate regulon response regulator PhoB
LNHRLQQRRPDQFRVMVVIDEIYAQKAVIEYVHQEGYRVSGFGDYKEAIRAFGHEPAHLVIADLTRPQLHAAEMASALKRHSKALVAVAIVSKLPTVEEQAEDAFEGYLVKPIVREDIADQLRELLLSPQAEHKPAILVLDDDADSLMAAEHSLQVRGFEVITYTDAGEAIAHLRATPPDLLLMDINMPGITGIQICRQLKADSKTAPIPILIFTSDPSTKNVQEAIASGASGFIAKPFDPKSLSEKVRSVLDTPA